MADQIKCLPLVKTTDGPLFNEKPGTLSELTNMTLQPGGFAEARGGLEDFGPSGGSPALWLTAGGVSAIHQLTTSYGWVRTYDAAAGAGSQYSKNLQLDPGGWTPFPTGVANDAIYWGSDVPFSRVTVYILNTASMTTPVWTYEYWNGSWTALTTAETITWTSAGLQYASWTLKADWAATTVGDAGTGNILKYWVRCRLSSIAAVAQVPTLAYTLGTWAGMREVYVACQNPLAGGANGTLKRYGQSGTTGEAFPISTTLFSGAASPTRIVSYRGRIFVVNGKDSKRWDGSQLVDIGLPQNAWTVVSIVATGSATAIPAGTYRWYAAWGYGPLTDVAVGYSNQGDVAPLYGWGRATYLGEQTFAAASYVTITFTGTTVPADASCYAIYRSQDLTSVSAPLKPNIPAFMVESVARISTSSTFATAFGTATPIDGWTTAIYPPIEMFNYDVTPPVRPKHVLVHQNRLLLGTDDTWYWSDAFVPDRFRKFVSYMSLAKATGGRHMGGAEFADQAVLFTEDQTWGLTNIDLDVPNLYPIHPGVGCIAPDSVATGDGLIVWAARDGIYAWDGGRLGPKKVSWDWNETFGKMSYETHGGSRAIIHNYHYDIRLASPNYTTTQGLFRLNLLTMQWSTITHATGINDTLYPFGPVHAPLGSLDAGGLHPLYAPASYTGSTDYAVWLGEYGTDDGSYLYDCTGTMHFPLPPGGSFVPQRVLGYYTAANGWGAPGFQFPPGTSVIGDPLGTLTAGTADTGADYSVVGATPAEAGAGTSNLLFKFIVPTVAGGTAGKQRFYGGVLEGRRGRIRVGSV